MTEYERFAARVVCDVQTRCWIWVGGINGGHNPRGYFVTDAGQTVRAARYAWEQAHGKPLGERHALHIRTCPNTLCVCPSHLYAGTELDNRRDRTALQTHCAKGHPFNEANTYWRPEGRRCRACRHDAVRRWRVS